MPLTPTVLPLASCNDAVDAELYAARYLDAAIAIRRAADGLVGWHSQPHQNELLDLAEAYQAIADQYDALRERLAAAERAD